MSSVIVEVVNGQLVQSSRSGGVVVAARAENAAVGMLLGRREVDGIVGDRAQRDGRCLGRSTEDPLGLPAGDGHAGDADQLRDEERLVVQRPARVEAAPAGQQGGAQVPLLSLKQSIVAEQRGGPAGFLLVGQQGVHHVGSKSKAVPAAWHPGQLAG